MTKTHVRREVAVSGDLGNIKTAVLNWTIQYQRYGVGATVIPTIGYWNGMNEKGAIVRFDWPDGTRIDGHQGGYLFEELLTALAVMLPEQRLFHSTWNRIHFTEEKAYKIRKGIQ